MIRKAEEKDIDDLIDLSEAFFKESLNDYGLTCDKETLREQFEFYIKNLIVLVAEEEYKIEGFICGTFNNSMFNKSQIIAQEIAWYVKKEKRRGISGIQLIKAFEKECKNKGVNFICMVHMGNLNAEILDKYYKKRNYKLLERDYIKEL